MIYNALTGEPIELTTAPTTAPTVVVENDPTTTLLAELDRLDTSLYAGLSGLILGIAGQHINADLIPDDIDTLLTDEGRATIRAKAGTATKKPSKRSVVFMENIEGEESYLRPNGDLYFSRKWGEHTDIEVLRKAREKSHYVLLYGNPGTGKTAMVEAGFPDDLYTILGSGDTEVGDLVGGYVQTPSGNFEWVDGNLVRAAEEGKVLLIDEIGLIDPKVLSVVYGLMDGRKELVVTANPERGVIKAKEGFFVIAATNPNAPGVRLSEALLSRFTIQAELTTDFGLAKKMGVPLTAVTASQNLNKKQSSGEVSWSPQMRELLAFQKVSVDFGTKFAISNILASAPEIDRGIVQDVFTRVFGEECMPAKI